jgi:hypothetical protein
MSTETLHFKIGLSGSSDKKHPEFSIHLNDKEYVNTKLSGGANQIEFFEFNAEIEQGPYNLIIEFKNKLPEDTVVENGSIIEDLLLNIESIEIDEIDMGSLLWTASDYRPLYPESYSNMVLAEGKELKKSVKNCVNLGWNGRWIFPFQSPFYIWLLENI